MGEKPNAIRILELASDKAIRAELSFRTKEFLVANNRDDGDWTNPNVIQVLNNELTGRYMKRTTLLAIGIAGLSLVVSLGSLFVSLRFGNLL
ncbi:MAG: hypothetical protein RIB80_18540 [Rhodospirillales bacterium]